MRGFKGILDPDIDPCHFQGFGCLWMNGLHAYVGKLIGHIKICGSHRL